MGDYIWLHEIPVGCSCKAAMPRRVLARKVDLRAGNEWCACMRSFGGQATDILCHWHVQIKSLFALIRAKFADTIAMLTCVSG